jgi:hypothetical protein
MRLSIPALLHLTAWTIGQGAGDEWADRNERAWQAYTRASDELLKLPQWWDTDGDGAETEDEIANADWLPVERRR